MIQRIVEAILRPIFKLVGDLMRGLFVAPFKALLGVKDEPDEDEEEEAPEQEQEEEEARQLEDRKRPRKS